MENNHNDNPPVSGVNTIEGKRLVILDEAAMERIAPALQQAVNNAGHIPPMLMDVLTDDLGLTVERNYRATATWTATFQGTVEIALPDSARKTVQNVVLETMSDDFGDVDMDKASIEPDSWTTVEAEVRGIRGTTTFEIHMPVSDYELEEIRKSGTFLPKGLLWSVLEDEIQDIASNDYTLILTKVEGATWKSDIKVTWERGA